MQRGTNCLELRPTANLLALSVMSAREICVCVFVYKSRTRKLLGIQSSKLNFPASHHQFVTWLAQTLGSE